MNASEVISGFDAKIGDLDEKYANSNLISLARIGLAGDGYVACLDGAPSCALTRSSWRPVHLLRICFAPNCQRKGQLDRRGESRGRVRGPN